MYYLFDFDGTLISPLPIDYVKLKKHLTRDGEVECSKSLMDIVYSDKSRVEWCLKEIDDAECVALDFTSMNPKVLDLYLKSSPKIILSRNGRAVIDKLFNTRNLPYPDFISCRDNCRYLKPDLMQINAIYTKFPQLSPKTICIVGDSWHDEMLAKNSGCSYLHPENL
jgi:phosphoglycolate phosphatase-like HAD superfamily hydrolase